MIRLLCLIACFFLSTCTSNAAVQFIWSGAATSNSIIVKAKLTNDNSVGRLVYSTAPDLSSPNYSLPNTAIDSVNNRLIVFNVNSLTPNTQYYYGCEVDGVIDTAKLGRFKTFPADSGSFSFAFASCALTASNHAVFETIRSLNPLFFFHLGDFHYENISVDDPAVFRQKYEMVLASPNQSRLYRDIDFAYIWDDHDFGPNNSDSTAPGRTAARLTYEQYVPHYPLAAGESDNPIYFAFTVGRVRFIVTDSRSARSPATNQDNAAKTVLGVAQKQWFKQELATAKSFPLVVWVSSFPWIGTTGDDGWYLYTYERRELANFIKDNELTNLCMISGDAHMVAIDDGSHSDYATGGGASFPVFHAAALDQAGSVKGGPYSEGAFPGGGRFGWFSVTDFNDSLKVDWIGKNSLNQTLVSYSFTKPVCHGIDPTSGSPCDCCVGVRGNTNNIPGVSLLDLLTLIGYVLQGGAPPSCLEEANINGQGSVTVQDIVYLVSYLFNNGPQPVACP